MKNEKIKTAFEKLTGRTASDAELAALYRTQQVLQLSDDDPIWLILIALQYYLRLYQDIPESITKTQVSALETLQGTIDGIVSTSTARAQEKLAQCVEQTAREIASNTSRKQLLQSTAAAVIMVAGSIGSLSYYINNTAYTAGYNAGYGSGRTESVDEKIAANWANTTQGTWAQWMVKNGVFADIASCRLPGWKKRGGRCYPYADPASGTVYGWRIPPQYNEEKEK